MCTLLNWIPEALRMNEAEIIHHAGLDSAVFLVIYLLGYPPYFLNPTSKKYILVS